VRLAPDVTAVGPVHTVLSTIGRSVYSFVHLTRRCQGTDKKLGGQCKYLAVPVFVYTCVCSKMGCWISRQMNATAYNYQRSPYPSSVSPYVTPLPCPARQELGGLGHLRMWACLFALSEPCNRKTCGALLRDASGRMRSACTMRRSHEQERASASVTLCRLHDC
jgi:hypothetical protein